MSFYLLEIGCEEIPASFIAPAAEYLKKELEKKLGECGLNAAHVISGGTPRRLYVYADGLPETQPEKTETVMGPPASVAFLENGDLSPVGLKFVAARGLDAASVKKAVSPKGEYLAGEKRTGGKNVREVLSEIVPAIIKEMPFPKSMRWGDGEFRFARPIHWFLSVFSGSVVEFEIDGIKASSKTYGHRFMSPGPVAPADFEEYKNALADAYVIVDAEERKKIIRDRIAAFEEKSGLKVPADEDLVDTVAGLTEYPHAVLGSFDEEFLKLPREVLITSMKVHQKYFPAEDKAGRLVNKFVGFSNTAPEGGDDEIRTGYERVLRARLNDAAFFFENDLRVPLSERAERLKKVVYQEKLGTSYEKMKRFEALAVKLAENFAPDKSKTTSEAALICKADLMSEMVYEFPELQGIMGSYYARHEGRNEDVCSAVFEHYLPRFAGDALPKTWEGRFVSVADKLDTIAGAFAVGNIPTGNVDPYGLRRCAIGILSVIEDAGIRLDLKDPINFALENLGDRLKTDKTETAEKIASFIMQRWKQMLVGRGEAAADIFEAVSEKYGDPIALKNLVKVLTTARGSDEFKTIAASFKRINNILKKSGRSDAPYKRELFLTEEEKTLADLIENQNIETLLKEEKNYDTLDQLLKFAPALDAFFQSVMVMAEDEAVKNNRLSLISKLRDVFLSVGNFEEISL